MKQEEEIISERVRVFCRIRPVSSSSSSHICHDDKTVKCEITKSNEKTFTYDRVLNASESNADVFESASESIVEDAIQGYNGTIFAYGQTGSGKTYTMLGPDEEDVKHPGLYVVFERGVRSLSYFNYG